MTVSTGYYEALASVVAEWPSVLDDDSDEGEILDVMLAMDPNMWEVSDERFEF